MSSLQISSYSAFLHSPYIRNLSSSDKFARSSISISFWGRDLFWVDGVSAVNSRETWHRNRGISRVLAMSPSTNSTYKMNLNEYMVTLDKPLGIRFAISLDGRIFVHALKRGGNAEKSRIIMVGDTLKKASESSGGRLIEIKDIGDTEY